MEKLALAEKKLLWEKLKPLFCPAAAKALECEPDKPKLKRKTVIPARQRRIRHEPLLFFMNMVSLILVILPVFSFINHMLNPGSNQPYSRNCMLRNSFYGIFQ